MRRFSFLRRLSAFILGAVFLVSGLFKVMDPTGSSLVMESYLNFLHLGFLKGLSDGFSLIFNLLECFVGVSLISGIWVRVLRNITLGLLGIFTFLTLLLLIFNPEMDCGCFGEVIHLTHLQSFVKNLVLLALWALAFLPYATSYPRPLYRKVLSGISYAMIIAFTIYSYANLPLLDLTNLSTGHEIEEGDISLVDGDGEYVEPHLLKGKVAFISVYNPSKVSAEQIASARTLARKAGMRTVLAVNGTLPFEEDNAYLADRRTLMSISRANPGVTFISGGQIAQKWTMREFLSLDEDSLRAMTSTDPSELIIDESLDGKRKFEIFALVFFVILLV